MYLFFLAQLRYRDIEALRLLEEGPEEGIAAAMREREDN